MMSITAIIPSILLLIRLKLSYSTSVWFIGERSCILYSLEKTQGFSDAVVSAKKFQKNADSNCRKTYIYNKEHSPCQLRGRPQPAIKLTVCVCTELTVEICSHARCWSIPCVNKEAMTFYLQPRHSVRLLKINTNTNRPPHFEFNVTVYNRDDSNGFLLTTSLQSSFGYIRPSNSLARSVSFTDCVTLTAPSGHVIFLTRLQPITMGDLRVFMKQCAEDTSSYDTLNTTTCKANINSGGSKQNDTATCLEKGNSIGLQRNNFKVFSDWILSHDHTMALTFSFITVKGVTSQMMDSLRLVFSFHPNTSRPMQTEGEWNCSRAVWPELPRHFPCDLKPQCQDAEDENACDYAWKTRLSGYLFEVPVTPCHLCTTSDFKELQKKCQDRGAEPVTFPSPQEWSQFLAALAYRQDTYSGVWIDLHPAHLDTTITRDRYLRRMYINTWQWRGGTVAYYLDNTWMPNEEGTDALLNPGPSRLIEDNAVLQEWLFQRKIYKLYLKRNQSSAHQACEVPLPASRPQAETIVLHAPAVNTTALPVPLLTCPLQHVTHVAFACDQHSVCGGQLSSEGLSQITATCRGAASSQTALYFLCGSSGEGVPFSLVCDFSADCGDRSDELGCVFPPCTGNRDDCGNGQCLHRDRSCNGVDDCNTVNDERSCNKQRIMSLHNVIKPPALVDFNEDGYFTVTALPANTSRCPATHYQCSGDGYCLPVYTRCNGVYDCPGHEDEAGCDFYTCRGLYRCRGRYRTICMHVQHLCDGVAHCPLQDDELMCRMDEACPERCVCLGNSVARAETSLRLRYLDVTGSGVTLNSILNNSMLIHLKAQACGWKSLTEMTLPNLRVLDLSENWLQDLSFVHFTPLKNLQELSLAGNHLSPALSSFSGDFKLVSMRLLNLSRVLNQQSNFPFISTAMPHLQILDLSFSGLDSLQGGFGFKELQVLNLRGCPISDFSSEFMRDMSNLQHVTGDNYKLCCSAVLPESFTGKCLAPVNEISSCTNLLRSTVYELLGFLFAILALLGNLGSLLYRVNLYRRGENKVGFAVFVIHLAMSDSLMGLYLFMIGAANRVYAGVYLWHEMTWRHSAACSTAGFLSFLSCEVSSLLICLITLDRFLVIRFPFSRLRFGVASAQVACGITWGLGIILAAIPLLPVTLHWAFYSQTGICVPLPVTRTDFPGQHYSFTVMIVLNLTLFLLIATGQSLIYWSVKVNTMSDDGLKNKDSAIVKGKSRSKEVTIARRLLVIAMSDFLCWFPIGVCGLVAKLGVPVPGEVNAAMATLVLPFNAALNPFLYTYTALQQKQRQQKESRLQAVITAQVKKEVGRVLSTREMQKQTAESRPVLSE